AQNLADVKEGNRAKVIRKGWGWKKGTMSFSSWKLRFFVLLSTRELLYYETEVGKESLGNIDLKKKKNVRPGKSQDKPQGFEEVLEIETRSRTWYFSPKAMNRGEHSHEMSEWLKVINESDVNFEKYHGSVEHRRGSFEYSNNSFFITPQDTNADDFTNKSVP